MTRSSISPVFPYHTIAVTGAGRGIGRIVSLALAELGADVIAISRTASDLDALPRIVQAMPGKIVPFCGDVTNAEHMSRVFRDVASAGRPADVLICCAGAVRRMSPVVQSNPLVWANQVQTAIIGAYLPTREFLRHADWNSLGLILHFSSAAAVVPMKGYSAYGVGKAAVEHFTAAVAAELRDSDIAAACIRPRAYGVRRGRFGWTSSDRRAVQLVIDLAHLNPDRVQGRVFVT
jgi:NAD(P)-dependent dehydrogenase (short-subunit alcohol dehydrogenase family)